MKKVIGIVILCLSVFLCSSTRVIAHEPPGIAENIAAAIKAGNSKELAKYFGPTVEIILPGSDGAYSKAQAEMIMKDFFARYVPVSFVVNQNKMNSTGGSQFIIGTYKSKEEVLNVYILLKPVSNQFVIQQIHFEAD
jgi:hypothetical protein